MALHKMFRRFMTISLDCAGHISFVAERGEFLTVGHGEAHSLLSVRSRRKIPSSAPATSDRSASSSGLLFCQTLTRSSRTIADLSSFESATPRPPPPQATAQPRRFSVPSWVNTAWWQDPLESNSPERWRYLKPSRNELCSCLSS